MMSQPWLTGSEVRDMDHQDCDDPIERLLMTRRHRERLRIDRERLLGLVAEMRDAADDFILGTTLAAQVDACLAAREQ